MKTTVDLAQLLEQTTCSPFYDPDLLSLVRKSAIAVFRAFMAGLALTLSMVLLCHIIIE